MTILNQFITAFLVLIEVGGSFRIGKIILDTIAEPDDASQNLKKGKNVVIFMILSALILTLKEVVVKYYS